MFKQSKFAAPLACLFLIACGHKKSSEEVKEPLKTETPKTTEEKKEQPKEEKKSEPETKSELTDTEKDELCEQARLEALQAEACTQEEYEFMKRKNLMPLFNVSNDPKSGLAEMTQCHLAIIARK